MCSEDFEKVAKAYDVLLNDKKYPIIHFLGKNASFTKGTREFSVTSRGTQYSLAEAYVFSSLPHRLLANSYLKINKPTIPTKFFSKEEDAVKWLKSFL